MAETNRPQSTPQPAEPPPSRETPANIHERTEQLERKVDDLSEMFERIERTLAEARERVDEVRD